MKDYLIGNAARKVCQEILDQFYVDETYNKHLGKKGYFKEYINVYELDKPTYKKEGIIAFDNTTGDCLIEQFDNVTSAIRWLQA